MTAGGANLFLASAAFFATATPAMADGLAVTPAEMPVATQMVAYVQAFTASGGEGSYSWSFVPTWTATAFCCSIPTTARRSLGFVRDASTRLSTIAGLGWERPGYVFRGWASSKANADAVWLEDDLLVETEEGLLLVLSADGSAIILLRVT